MNRSLPVSLVKPTNFKLVWMAVASLASLEFPAVRRVSVEGPQVDSSMAKGAMAKTASLAPERQVLHPSNVCIPQGMVTPEVIDGNPLDSYSVECRRKLRARTNILF